MSDAALPSITPGPAVSPVPSSWDDPQRVARLVLLIAETDAAAAAALWIEYRKLSGH